MGDTVVCYWLFALLFDFSIGLGSSGLRSVAVRGAVNLSGLEW